MKRHRATVQPKPAAIVVEQGRGVVVGYEMSDGRYVKAGEPCCSDPFSCTRCFGPVHDQPWWRWRR